MNRKIALSDRLVVVLTALNLWAVGGGGIMISFAGRPLFGMILLAASIVVSGLTLTGRIGKNREYTIANLTLAGVGIPILVFGVVLMGAVFPSSMNLIWYSYLTVLLFLSVAAIGLVVRDARSTT